MPPEKPPNTRRGAARHTPDQQPSLLDQLELDEESVRKSGEQSKTWHKSPGHEDGDDQRAADAEAELEDPRPGVAQDQPEPLPEQPTEKLQRAYARYVEIIDTTYSSTFSDAKRQAAFKEAAKAHGVRITDLKRYSTAAALGIPYETDAEDGAGTEPDPGTAPLGPDTSETD